MPELPEVETVMQGLRSFLEGRKISHVECRSPSLRKPLPSMELQGLCGLRILPLRRRAKYILVPFAHGKTLVAHLGMTGSFTVFLPEQVPDMQLDRHDHVVITMEDGTTIVYRDPRRFGVMDVLASDTLSTTGYFADLGPEPLEDSFTAERLLAALRTRKSAIKPALMDQSVVVGVGNIYASEALYLSGIHPETPANQISLERMAVLVQKIKAILTAAIRSGGSTLRDYRRVGGERGYFQFQFSVYDRVGQACPDCTCSLKRTGGIQRIVQSGRSTFFCPVKQV